MSNVNLEFFPRDPGGAPGDYEMFIVLDSSAFPSSITLNVPSGWSTKGIKVYSVTKNPNEKVTPNPEKQADKAKLNGAKPDYPAMFGPLTSPAGFFFDPINGTLLMTSATEGLFEFLVWIQDAGGNNDYLDPGIRNHK